MKALLFILALLPAFTLAQPSPTWKPYVDRGDATSRALHLRVLGGNPTKENLRIVVGALTDPDDSIREVACEILRKNKSMSTFDLIVEGMPQGSQFHAGHFLAKDFRETKYVQRMVKLLKHEDEGIRRPMAMIMGIIKEPSAFLPLVQMARDPNPLAREIARNALVGYNSWRNKESLKKLANHDDPKIRDMALEVLRAQG